MKRPESEVDDILNSLDGISRAGAKPFMYTRVMARLQKEERNIWLKAGSLIARPIVAGCCILAILTINIYFIIDGQPAQEQETATAVVTAEQQPADNYTLAMNNNYILTNFEQ